MKRRNPNHKLSGAQRCDQLSRIAGLIFEIGALLKAAEAPNTYKRYRAFIKSLDGAIRHAQRQRNEEEIAKFITDDGFALTREGNQWTDGDLYFKGDNVGPVGEDGARIAGRFESDRAPKKKENPPAPKLERFTTCPSCGFEETPVSRKGGIMPHGVGKCAAIGTKATSVSVRRQS